ncbi:phosphate acyltransferase PlsX [candidate division KSB1 bacterium]|nr:phosphate acyltransferase PlsX [candidate division KSB1 bacterium]
MKIALDAMGGDHAPQHAVHGGIEAARISKGRFAVVLVGDQGAVEKEIAKHFRTQDLPLTIVHASQRVEMNEKPAVALKQKPDSSIAVATRLHANREVDALVSAGNTGVVMAHALFGLKRVAGIRRPAIGSLLPNQTGGTTLLLDVGANVDSRPEDLVQFGMMGSIYVSRLFEIATPRVGLLNVGHEEGKGNEVSSKAFALFKNCSCNFIGNVEGGDILRGTCDVVVCDGFVGNIVLKAAESLHGLFKMNMRRLVKKYLFSQIGALLMKPTFEGIRKVFDYEEYGGAPLLGVQGCCIIAHGKSTPRAIKNAILAAFKFVTENVNGAIKEQATLPLNDDSQMVSQN